MQKTFEGVIKQVKKKSFGILSTIDSSGWVQSSGVQYGVSLRGADFALYILSDSRYVKVRNIEQNHRVSFVIPFPHHFLRFIPAPTVSFKGTAEILPFDDSRAREAYCSRSQKRMIRFTANSDYKATAVFLRLTPIKRIVCYGLGIKLADMMRDPANALYTVQLAGK